MTYVVTKSISDIVSEAFRLLNIIDGEQDPDATQMTRGARMLQIMLKSLQAQGPQMYLRRDIDIQLVASVVDYPMSAEPTDIIELISATVVDPADTNEIERPVTIISRSDYEDQLNKLVTSTVPNMIVFETTDTDSTILVWPVPTESWILRLDARIKFTEFTLTTDEIEVPDYWIEAIIYRLAERFIIPFGRSGTPTAQEVRFMAADLYNTAAAFDVEQDGGGEVRFVPGEPRYWPGH